MPANRNTMKKLTRLSIHPALLLASLLLLGGCETVIDANLDEGPAQLSVDGFITDQPGPQTIRLTQTTSYFNNGTPPAATSATVTLTDNVGNTFSFTDSDNDGYYVWQPPTPSATLGQIGRTYQLSIRYQNDEYRATSTINRVPVVDSIIFREEKLNPLSDETGYQAEFFARDLPGQTDYYRVRYFRNGELQNRPGNIITLENASFQGSADTDGLVFIRPFRQSINPENFYDMGDSVTVEIQSITPDAFSFFQSVSGQITNGGLFATPATNVPTNVVNTTPNGRPATGYFITSAVRSKTVRVGSETIRE
ncbi:hypothetical protein BN8_05852 [Fibrisoma limi BUZ 3]|uniref:DUF4249 domain-containing protein n=2 Tax=Fibrisoma limi TaxID=663275 RepID=I2GRH9_9BACT|nr:hypothetical protein BN8_05852 [Fibrisoma limi BUZ 3]